MGVQMPHLTRWASKARRFFGLNTLAGHRGGAHVAPVGVCPTGQSPRYIYYCYTRTALVAHNTHGDHGCRMLTSRDEIRNVSGAGGPLYERRVQVSCAARCHHGLRSACTSRMHRLFCTEEVTTRPRRLCQPRASESYIRIPHYLRRQCRRFPPRAPSAHSGGKGFGPGE